MLNAFFRKDLKHSYRYFLLQSIILHLAILLFADLNFKSISSVTTLPSLQPSSAQSQMSQTKRQANSVIKVRQVKEADIQSEIATIQLHEAQRKKQKFAELQRIKRQIQSEKKAHQRLQARKKVEKRQKWLEIQQLKRELQQVKRSKNREQKKLSDLKRKVIQAAKAEKIAKTAKKPKIISKQEARNALETERILKTPSKIVVNAFQQTKKGARQLKRQAREIDRYKAQILQVIARKWILPENLNDTLSCQLRIRLAANGAVLSVQLERSSGDAILDRSARSAVFKASPLPMPKDLEISKTFREICLTVRPESVVNHV